VLLLVLAVAAGGCTVGAAPVAVQDRWTPGCEAVELRRGGAVSVLMAQAVPEAALVPCLDALPVGWTLAEVEIERGAVEIAFASDREGPKALTIHLEPACDVSHAVPVPTDEPGTRRFESVAAVRDRYVGQRYYTFDGGCVTYDFALQGQGWSAQVNSLSGALSFRTRESLGPLLEEHFGAPVEGP
jgi:hypothetical protein